MSKRILYNISSSNLITTNVSAGTINLSTGLTSNKIIINNTLTTTGNYIYGTNGNSFTTNVLSNLTKLRVSRAVANSCVSSWALGNGNAHITIRGSCWSPELGIFVVTGISNNVLTSPDGLTWTSRSISQNNQWGCVTWSSELGLFVAGAATGTNRIMTSSDGISWTMQNVTTNTYSGICWCRELLIFVTVGSTVSRSSDGVSWSNGTIPAGTWNSVCWSPELGLFVAVNNTGGIATSTDGSTFTSQTSPISNNLVSVCWSPELNLFVAVGGTASSTSVVTSNNGITWTLRTTPLYLFTSLAWSPYLSIFVAVGLNGVGMSSSDGITWTDLGIVSDASVGNRTICWSPELSAFIFGQGTTANGIYKSTPPSLSIENLNVYGSLNVAGIIRFYTTAGNVAGWIGTSDEAGSSNKIRIVGERGGAGAILLDTNNGTSVASRMIIEMDGNVGIGTTSPAANVHLFQSTNPAGIFIDKNNERAAIQLWNYSNTRSNLLIGSNVYWNTSGSTVLRNSAVPIAWQFYTGSNIDKFTFSRVTATNTGVDFFTMVSSGSTTLTVIPGLEKASNIRIGRNDLPTTRYHDLEFQTSSTAASTYMAIKLHDGVTTTSQKEVMRIRGDGNVGIGTTAPESGLHVAGAVSGIDVGPLGSGVHMGIDLNSNTAIQLNAGTVGSNFSNLDFGYGGIDYVSRISHSNSTRALTFLVNSSTTASMVLNSSGSVSITGALSKGSGSFDIDHPILETKRLVHSFIEGPRCDLIYRGKVTLTNGMATVNIDTDCVHESDCAMTDGTFTSLCANPQFFLQNTNSFKRLRGSISGNILTITCVDNTSTDEVYWKVIAERKDPFIKSWIRTNSNGYLVTKYDKE